MANPKSVIIVLALTVLGIGGLGLWVAYRGGELSALRERVANQEFPRVISESDEDLTLPITNHNEQTMNTAPSGSNPLVTLKTNRGDITLELYMDLMPITVGNFLTLAQKDFYDGTKFHRVIDGFMIQGGDPNTKTDKVETYGTGGPGYTIQDEFIADQKLSNARGTIAMANTGAPNSGGSQFFINLIDNTGLDFDKPPAESSHPVFGRVVAGMEVVDTIAKVPTGANNRPNEPVIVEDVVIQAGQ